MIKKAVLAGLLISVQIIAGAQSKTCSCFLIKETKGNLSIEKTEIENNNVQVFGDPDIIAPVFSLGEGMNGDMVQKERRGGMVIAQCKDKLLKLKFKSKDGTEKPLPDMDIFELRQLNIRINVVGGDGNKKAFLIEKYKSIREDKGPVIDMFGGKLPVKPGDYIITTETKKPVKANTLTGKTSCKISNGWIVVPVTLSNGIAVNFVVDLAATSSVIDKKYLPQGAEINKIEMVEYSANGANKKEATMQGATGKVEKGLLAGKSLLKQINIGDMKIEDVNISVLNTFPEKLKKAGVVGIIGTDILIRSGTLSIQSINKDKGVLQFGSGFENTDKGIEIPFTMAGGLLFTEGTIGAAPVKFLFDTGARESILSKSFAEENNLVYPVVNKNKTITGIDGRPLHVKVVKVSSYSIKEYSFSNTNMILGDIAALSAFGLQKSSAILGMDFFRQYASVEFDFNSQHIRLQ